MDPKLSTIHDFGRIADIGFPIGNAIILPWRNKLGKKLLNPYHIFVSEFMLQLTTVNAVIPKFNGLLGFGQR